MAENEESWFELDGAIVSIREIEIKEMLYESNSHVIHRVTIRGKQYAMEVVGSSLPLFQRLQSDSCVASYLPGRSGRSGRPG